MTSNSPQLKKKRKTFESYVELALKTAKKSGADFAEITVAEDKGLSVSVRNGEIETLENHARTGIASVLIVAHPEGDGTMRISVDCAEYSRPNWMPDIRARAAASPLFDWHLMIDRLAASIEADEAVDLSAAERAPNAWRALHPVIEELFLDSQQPPRPT